jgi:hypothetical protein
VVSIARGICVGDWKKFIFGVERLAADCRRLGGQHTKS